MTKTEEQFEAVLSICENTFLTKMEDYGTAWRVMRPASLTDQIYIKVNRIRTLQITGKSLVDEGIVPEFIGIVNYALMALIQLERGTASAEDERARHDATVVGDYERHAAACVELMRRKNHDYNEAWRLMRVNSVTDIILMKVLRTKEIEDNDGETQVSEGLEANYRDMMNYAVFALVKLFEEQAEQAQAPRD